MLFNRCEACGKRYERMTGKKGWSAHKQTGCHADGVDYKLFHSKSVITIGLMRILHNTVISYADGQTLMSLYKYMSIWCKNLELDNYAKGLLELHFQLAILPSHLRVSLIQNRSVNSRGQPNTNIPVDLCLEHENRRFKEQAKTYRGEFTQKAIDKISKASNVTRTMVKQLKVSTNLHQREVGVHTQKDPTDDIVHLVQNLHSEDLLEYRGSRSFGKVFVSPSIFQANSNKLCSWMSGHIKSFRTRHFYRYVNTLGK